MVPAFDGENGEEITGVPRDQFTCEAGAMAAPKRGIAGIRETHGEKEPSELGFRG